MPVQQADFYSGDDNNCIVYIQVCVSERFMGAVIGDLNTRRSKVISLGTKGPLKVVCCEVPMKELFDYPKVLRLLTDGSGIFMISNRNEF